MLRSPAPSFRSQSPRHIALFASVSVLALTMIAPYSARARDLTSTASPAAVAAAAATSAAQQAATATQQAQQSMLQTTQSIRAFLAAQAAARSAAQAAASAVPNGLVTGGLKPDSGFNGTGAVNPVSTWVNANAPTQSVVDGQTTVTIGQTAAKAILNWETFNVGRNTIVYFNQSAGTATDGSNSWVALNRIGDPSGVPSQILGQIKADGSVYLINRNGIIFGGSAQVNVNTLIASSLSLFSTDLATSNAAFLNHGIADQTWLSTGAADRGANAVVLTTNDATVGPITVQAGAQITANKLGLVLLAAPQVTNAGTITAPDGQVALIGGIGVETQFFGSSAPSWDAVYTAIAAPAKNLAFYNYGKLTDSGGNDITPKGQVLNTGLITADRGNITLRARDIVQNGVLATTTSVSSPGSILIFADNEDLVPSNTSGSLAAANAMAVYSSLTGSVTFGSGSVTTILPDTNNATVPTGSVGSVVAGSIQVHGLMIDYKSGSLLYAPGQSISSTITYGGWGNSAATLAQMPSGAGRILVESGAVIDASGIADVELPVSSTLITAKLGANELADTPLQRNGALYGKTITVNSSITGTRSDGSTWVGTPIANLTSYLNVIPQKIDQILTKAGSVSFKGAEVDLAKGAVINLTGGYVHYIGGMVSTTQLVSANGSIVDIAKADPNQTYAGIYGGFTVSNAHWNISDTYVNPLAARPEYVPDYIVGGSAGALAVNVNRFTDDYRGALSLADRLPLLVPSAGAMVIAASIDGRSVSGVYQVANGKLATAGSLSITTDYSVEITDASGASLPSYLTGALSLPGTLSMGSALLATLPSSAGGTSPATTPTANAYANGNVISSSVLTGGGLASLAITSNSGSITVEQDAKIDVQTGGSITLKAMSVRIDGALTARSGSINVTADAALPIDPTTNRPGNPIPFLLPSSTGAYAAGSGYSAGTYPKYFGDIIVGSHAVLDASGLFVNDAGHSGGSVLGPAGLNGGSISLVSKGEIGLFTIPQSNGQLISYDASGSVVLASGSLLDVSGGGRVLPSGALQTSGGLPVGSGGSVTLATYAGTSAQKGTGAAGVPYPTQGRLQLDGTIKGLGFSGGGTLTLQALAFQVGGSNSGLPEYATYFDPSVWGARGFASLNLMAAYDIVVPDNAKITLQHSNLIANAGTVLAPTGANLANYTSVGVLDPSLRTPTNLSLTAALNHTWGDSVKGDYAGSVTYSGLNAGELAGFCLNGAIPLAALIVGSGAEIVGDATSKIALESDGILAVLGKIRTPGGSISLTNGHYYDCDGGTCSALSANAVLYLGSASVLDASGGTVLNTRATPVLTNNGLVTPRTGTLLDGGTITLTSDTTPIAVASGATLDVRGTADSFDVIGTGAIGLHTATLDRQAVWSNGGMVAINASSALRFDGTLLGQAGDARGSGATLAITHDNLSKLPYMFNGGTGSLVLVQNAQAAGLGATFVPSGYRLGQTFAPAEAAKAEMLFGADSLKGSGFDSLVVTSPVLAYAGAVSIGANTGTPLKSLSASTANIVALPTATFDWTSSVSVPNTGALSATASYISVAGTTTTLLNTSTAIATSGALTLEADQIDLGGVIGLQNIGAATFTSHGDLRLLPGSKNYAETNTRITGVLFSNGGLTFNAARIYPTTDTTYIIKSPTSVTFGYAKDPATGAVIPPTTATPLSANATLLVDAVTINQNGNLSAPFGSIILGLRNVGGVAETYAAAMGDTSFSVDGVGLTLPLGVITQSVSLGAGSITSVSGNGAIIPYGTTLDGSQWLYNPASSLSSTAAAWSTPLTAPPSKSISLIGQAIEIKSGAKVDLSGGGDLQAAEWVPGTGGSRDVLAQNNVVYSNGVATTVPLYPDQRAVYAILPGYSGKTAAYDPNINFGLSAAAAGTGSAAGQAVYLSGVPGLKDGTYTLLPGAYATLPGAYRVVINAGVTNPLPYQLGTQADGTVYAAGYLTNTLTGARSSTTTEFIVQSSSVWQKYSEYRFTSANTFFPAYASTKNYATPALPMDAGRMLIGEATTTSLILRGSMATTPASVTSADGSTQTGAGAQVDLTAQYIEVVNGVATGGPTTATIDSNTYVLVSAADLTGLNAGSLLIGGTRTRSTSGIAINAVANGIVVANDASAPLSAPEILLVAAPILAQKVVQVDNTGASPDTMTVVVPQAGTGAIELRSGSVIRATGASPSNSAVPVTFGAGLSGLPALPTSVLVSDIAKLWGRAGLNPFVNYYAQVAASLGSLVQVSTGTAVKVTQPTYSQLNPGSFTTVDDVSNTANFTVALPSLASTSSAVVRIQANASVAGGNVLQIAATGDLRIAPGAGLSGRTVQIDSSQITFAGTGAGTLPGFGTVVDSALWTSLAGADRLVFQSASAIDFNGSVTLTLPTGELALSAGSFTASTGGAQSITARRVTFSNDLSAPASASVAATGGSLTVAADEIDLGGNAKFAGFASANFTAARGIVGRGTGTLDFGPAGLTLTTPVLIAGAGSGQTLKTSGALALLGRTGTPLDASAEIGGAITLVGATITGSAPISARSGNVTLQATTGDVALNDGAAIDVSAVSRKFFDVTEYTSAGRIALTSDAGSVRVASSVALDLSSSTAGGGDAGSLTVTATKGRFDFSGSLNAAAASGYQGGSFSLDAQALSSAGKLTSLDTLASVLGNAGFNTSIALHVRSGDLSLSQSSILKASQVSLTTDGGAIAVAGTIDASGTAGGEIDLYGAKGVALSGSLLARGSDPNQRGGTVKIGTTGVWDGVTHDADGSEHLTGSGAITLAAGSLIDVSGGTYAGLSGGTVSLRAPIVNGAVNVAVSSQATIKGARSVVLEAYKTWDTSAGGKFDGIVDPQGLYDSNGAALAGVWTNAQVVSISVTSGGSYTSAPTVTLSGGGGSGATAVAVTSGSATTTISNAGAGTNTGTKACSGSGTTWTCGSGSTAVTVTLSNATGTGLKITSLTYGTVGSTKGKLTAIVVDASSAAGYTGPVTFTATNSASTTAATGQVGITLTVTGITITNPGSGYTSAPTVTISDGTSTATATATTTVQTLTSAQAASQILLVGTGIFSASSPNTNHTSFYQTTLANFVENPGINTSAFSGIANFHLRPGVELVNNRASVNGGNITVVSDWDLGKGTGSYDLATGTYSAYSGIYRVTATGEPGVLSLRAANNVTFNAAGISDGFFQFNTIAASTYDASYQTYLAQLYDYKIALSNYNSNIAYFTGLGLGAPVAPTPPSYVAPTQSGANSLLQQSQMPASWGDSWSYRVVAGSDVASADPLAVKSLGDIGTAANDGSVILTGHRIYTYTVSTAAVTGTGTKTISTASDTTYAAYSPAGSGLPTTTLTYARATGSATAVFAQPAILRTGTGFIDVAAAKNVALTDPTNPDPLGSAVIYTAGKPTGPLQSSSPFARIAAALEITPLVSYFATTNAPTNGSTGLSTLLTGVTNPEGGGDITIRAGANVIGVEDARDTAAGLLSRNANAEIGQFWSPWLLQQGEVASSDTKYFSQVTSVPWYVNFGSFQQGVMSLGGNITVQAKGDIRDLSVSLPTTAYLTGAAGAQTLTLTGGGRMTVSAGGNIYSGAYYAGRGTGTIEAGGTIASDFTYFSKTQPTTGYQVATLLAVQDGRISVSARQSVDIGGVYDPTYLNKTPLDASTVISSPINDFSYLGLPINSRRNMTTGSNYGAAVALAFGTNSLSPYYASMTANSAVSARSTAGSLTFNSLAVQGNLFSYGTQLASTDRFNILNNPRDTTSLLLPATLDLLAFNGGITIDHGGGLFPSATGGLTVIADQSINMGTFVGFNTSKATVGNIPSWELQLLDYPLNTGLLPSPLKATFVDVSNAQVPTSTLHDPKLLQASGSIVRIYSRSGNIIDGVQLSDGTAAAELAIVSNRATQIAAGGSILDLVFFGQNRSEADITSIVAGDDITYLPVSAGNAKYDGILFTGLVPVIELAGPGSLLVQAGGDINFVSQRTGKSYQSGIRTIGNTLDTTSGLNAAGTSFATFGNPYLPMQGASATVLFGVGKGVDYQSFIAQYVDPAQGAKIIADEPAILVRSIAAYGKAIGDTSLSNLTPAQAWDKFQRLPDAWKQQIANTVFFAVLNETGLDYNNASSPYAGKYDRGYKAINTLFPAAYGYTQNSLTGGLNGANQLVHTGDLDLRGSTIQTQQGGDITIMGPGGSIFAGTQATPPSSVKQSSEGLITFESGSISTFTDLNVNVAQSRIMTEQGGDILMWSSNGNLDAGKGARNTYSFPPPVYTCNADFYCISDVKGLATGAGIAALQTLPNSPIGSANLIAPRGTVDAGAAGIRASGDLNIAALYVANVFNIQVQGTTTGIPTVAAPDISALSSASNASAASTKASDNPARAAGSRETPSVIIVEVLGYGGEPNEERGNEQRKRDGRRSGRQDPNSPVQVIGGGTLTQPQRNALTSTELRNLNQP